MDKKNLWQVAVKLKNFSEKNRQSFFNYSASVLGNMTSVPMCCSGDYNENHLFYLCSKIDDASTFIKKVSKNKLVKSIYIDGINPC